MARMADHGGGEDGGSSGESSSGGSDGHGPGSTDGQSQSRPTPVGASSDDNGQDANDADELQPPAAGAPGEGDDDDQVEACEMRSLKEGTAVRNAELAVTSTGATFREVQIIL